MGHLSPAYKQITSLVRLCQYILLVLIRVYSSVEPKFCDRYSLNVLAHCQMNLLALNSLRLPSFELSDNQNLEMILVLLSG